MSELNVTGWCPSDLVENRLEDRSTAKDLIWAVLLQVIKDLKEIRKLDEVPMKVGARANMSTILANWWGAKKYVASADFTEDCEILDLDPEVCREKLKTVITEGRKTYGTWVRTVPEIDLECFDLTQDELEVGATVLPFPTQKTE